MNVTDVITADQIELGDQIIVHNDPIEVYTKIDEDAILVKGWSHMSGDNVTYILEPDETVEVWGI